MYLALKKILIMFLSKNHEATYFFNKNKTKEYTIDNKFCREAVFCLNLNFLWISM